MPEVQTNSCTIYDDKSATLPCLSSFMGHKTLRYVSISLTVMSPECCTIYGAFRLAGVIMHSIRDSSVPDRELLVILGKRLAALRKARGLSQSEAAERSGLGRNTLYRAEQGDNPTLLTLVRLLRVYGRLGGLDNFIPEPEISPMARLRQRTERSSG